ncbi:hypothetical protein L228DRAFT_251533 [Xylona heveae TC161]|uniref:C2 domain-containing protein n=1 Tax=Xylona heveae (strain CBS 132557 / TC161) TaxID=1328760 RepID=A0A164ZE50_XYLHT|nr:hypothetical protein L228DRAFT_251533 [Xylona heveae TC161]KZF18987.1 hypothetical protein L228DRAFT_251533 [Xylona heveae TC161]
MASMHTSGIFSDMTVDGPEIGTLVIIVDKAKNLPNRRTMGKQDPYCAARLGKEAKKTETDKRGGQTPRWDQELRFTVHDSPDYNQLKVSVFNDDKKTELIGEAWVSLEAVVIPGGGQNDLWHTLTYRGKYAGEIRIELTYYDTRQKEAKVSEKQREVAKADADPAEKTALAGPRQLKPVRRRPLPTDPTGTASASTVPLIPPQASVPPSATARTLPPALSQNAHRQAYPPERMAAGPPAPNPYERHAAAYQRAALGAREPPTARSQGIPAPAPQKPVLYAEPASYESYLPEESATHAPYSAPRASGHGYNRFDPYDAGVGDTRRPVQSTQEPAHIVVPTPSAPVLETVSQPVYGATHNIAPTAHEIVANDYAGAPPHSAPPVMPLLGAPERYATANQVSQLPPPRSIPPRASTYYDNHPRHQSAESIYNGLPAPIQASMMPSARVALPEVDDGPPPPPPAHKSRASVARVGYDYAIPPAPLNIPRMKSVDLPSYESIAEQPQHQQFSAATQAVVPLSGVEAQQFEVSTPSRSNYSRSHRRVSGEVMLPSPGTEVPFGMPPSLVPGYDPSVADEVSDRMVHERRMSHVQPERMEPIVDSRPPPTYDHQPSVHDEYEEEMLSLPYPVNTEERAGRQERTPAAAVAPLVKPRAVSPVAQRVSVSPGLQQRPTRKSVSPHPEVRSPERRLSGAPFSPDSYDILNPKASSSSLNLSSQYHSADPSLEPMRDDGTLIGHDGRVIDPSDHLPTHTWAPEPEAKTPKKVAEPAPRSRPSPHGAQPMLPAVRRPLRETRPHSIAGPVYSHPKDPFTPPSVSRYRLQNGSGKSPTHPASSPIVPTVNTTPRSQPRSAVSGYPLRERENYGYDSSPRYSGYGSSVHSSPGGIPPLPAKLPLSGLEQQDPSMAALSEEMKRIDIGTVSRGRVRRSRFGP